MSNKIKISCKEASFLISKKQETKLNFYEKMQLALHLVICDVCKLFEKQMDIIFILLKQKPSNDTRLSIDSKKKIKEILEKEVNK